MRDYIAALGNGNRACAIEHERERMANVKENKADAIAEVRAKHGKTAARSVGAASVYLAE